MYSSLASIPSLETSQRFLSLLSGKAHKVDTLKWSSVLAPKNAYGSQRNLLPFHRLNVPLSVFLTIHRSELRILVYSGIPFPPKKIRHLPDAHHKYSIIGRAAIGSKISWFFSNRPAEDRPHACPKQGISPQSSIQCSSRVRTLMSQSACIANNIYLFVLLG